MVFLERAAHPLGRCEDDVRTGVGKRSRDLREAQVVTGHEGESDAAAHERLRLRDISRRDPIGLALPERVVQVELPRRGADPARIHRDDRVPHAALRCALQKTRDDEEVVGGGEGRCRRRR